MQIHLKSLEQLMWFQAWNHPKADRLYVEEATDNAVGTRMRHISRNGILEGPMLDFWRLFGLDRLWPRRVKTDSRNVPNILYMHFWPLMQRSLFNMIFCSAYAIPDATCCEKTMIWSSSHKSGYRWNILDTTKRNIDQIPSHQVLVFFTAVF